MSKIFVLALVLIAVTLSAYFGSSGTRWSSDTGFLFRSIKHDGATYCYALYVPRDHNFDSPSPLIVFLHGHGECGTDGAHQLAVGLAPRVLWNPELYSCPILFPQKPEFDEQWEAYADPVAAMLKATKAELSTDPKRIALTGLSQGGHGVWTINAALPPDTFSALAPICGYANVPTGERPNREWAVDPDSPMFQRIVEAAANTPVWAFHGDADDVVPAEHTESLVKAIRAAGGDARLTIYPGVGHNSWDNAYGEEGLGRWLLRRR